MALIEVSDIVNTDLNSGVFDELMDAIESRLQEQYEKGRIKGTEYATVYLGAMQSALAQSVQFVLGKQTADKQAELLDKQASVTGAQLTKTQAEIDLLNQKKFTEEAQIKDLVDGSSVEGLVGKQKELYTRQADGFLRDAEQKAAKVFSDLWSVARSSDPDATPLPQHVDQASMNVILEKVAEGIGIDKASLDV